MVRHVLVTGGNAGIGLALCQRLVVESGCHVYLGARSAEKGKAAVAEIVAAGGEPPPMAPHPPTTTMPPPPCHHHHRGGRAARRPHGTQEGCVLTVPVSAVRR